jgi:hypothetical protein
MHPIFGLLTLIGLGAFIVFAFRQGTRVRPDDRPDRGSGYGGGSDSGFTHHSGDGGFGHG